MRGSVWLLALGSAAAAAVAVAADVQSSAPSDLSVTVYRAPFRSDGRFDLNALAGFALITETRLVHLPAGESRLRFEGVADGIEPASALVSGLALGVVEKNRDAQLLSPSALVAQAAGKQVELLRSNPKTGNTERRAGTIISDGEGVIFKTEQGIEALRCSGLPETLAFESIAGLSARATLSVLVRTPTAATQQVTLSYLSRGFDWSADYTATLSADGKTLNLGAWLTLANSNGVGFPSAHTQVVAGRVNRAEGGEVSPIEIGAPILAQCWPRGSTSDTPPMVLMESLTIGSGAPLPAMAMRALRKNSSDAREEEIIVTASARQEQLGDLKLYRVPERTTVASRQSKQVRMLDRNGVPVTTVYGADLEQQPDSEQRYAAQRYAAQRFAADRLLRTKNTAANHLGLPLPSGSVAVYRGRGDDRQLESESSLRDLAVGQDVEIKMGTSADVQVEKVVETTNVDAAHARTATRVTISNARHDAIRFELRLAQCSRVLQADHPLSSKDGRPIFHLSIPAQGVATVRFVCAVPRT
jgi:hypothetical protein